MRPSPLRKYVAALGVGVLASFGLTTLPAVAAVVPPETVTVDLLGINDFHGRIETEGSVPGALKLASAVERIRAENPDTLFLAAGDNFGGATFTTLINDENPAVAALNAMKLDASSLGNHEFDQGFDILRKRMDGDPGYEQIQYKLLGANVSGASPAFEGNHIFTTDNGVKVGVIGLVTPGVPTLVSPGGITGLTFENMADTAEAQIAEVRANGADVVVIAVHEGANNGGDVHDTDSAFGQLVQTAADLGVVAIFSGHTHVKYLEEVTGSGGNTMFVLQTGSYTANLGRVTVEVSGSDVLSSTADMIPLADEPVLDGNPVIEEIKVIIDDAVASAEVLGEVIVGEIGADLNRAVKPNGEENRGGESPIGNLIADVQLWAVASMGIGMTPDLAFMNPGGIRLDMAYDEDENGQVTYKQVASMQPFGNTLEVFELTGAQIIEVLEEQWQPVDSRRPYLKLGVSERLKYTFDPEGTKGSHIGTVYFDGEPIDEDATFVVVANNFLAAGGDSFFTLAEGTNYADTGMSDLEAFVKYFEMMGTEGEPVMPDYVQRSLGVTWLTDADGVYTEGDALELDISSIVFSTTEPKPTSFSLYLTRSDMMSSLYVGEVDLTDEAPALTDEPGIVKIRSIIPMLTEEQLEDEWLLEIWDGENEIGYFLPITLGAADEPGDEDGSDEDGADEDGTDEDGTDEDGTDTPPVTDGDGSDTDAGDKDGTDGGDPLETLPPVDGGPDKLEDTGVDVATIITAAAVLLVGGAGFLLVRRRLDA